MQKYFTKCKTAKSQKKRTGYTKRQLLPSFLDLHGFAIYYRRGTKLAQSVVPLFFYNSFKADAIFVYFNAYFPCTSRNDFPIDFYHFTGKRASFSDRHFGDRRQEKKMTSLKKETISSIYKMKQCKVF